MALPDALTVTRPVTLDGQLLGRIVIQMTMREVYARWRAYAVIVSLALFLTAFVMAPTFRDGLATDYVTDAVLRSARAGRWETVDAGSKVDA